MVMRVVAEADESVNATELAEAAATEVPENGKNA